MAYNVVLSQNQAFTPGAVLPNIDWQFKQPNPLVINHFAGTEQPATINMGTVIKDYLSHIPALESDDAQDLATLDFENIYIKAQVVHPILNKQTKEWVSLTGEIADADAPGYLLANEAALEVATTLTFKSFNSMLPGSTETQIIFIAFGELESNELVEIDRTTFSIVLNVLSQTQTKSSKEEINFFQVKNDAIVPGTTFDVSAYGQYQIQVPDYINLTGVDFVSSSDGYKTYSGNGFQTVTIGLDDPVQELETGAHTELIVIEHNSGNVETLTLTTVLSATAADTMILTPDTMHWEVIRGTKIQSRSFKVENFGNNPISIVSSPSWVDVNITYQIPNFALVSVNPVNGAFLSPGTYNSTIVVESGPLTANLKLTMVVIANSNIALDVTGGINFTEDFEKITTFHYSSAFNIGLKLEADISSFQPYSFTTKTIEYLFGIHNFYADFFIGKVIKNLFTKLRDLAQINLNHIPSTADAGAVDTAQTQPHRYMYLPARVNIEASFINRQTGDVQFTDNWKNVNFIPGRKPPRVKVFPQALTARRGGAPQFYILDFYDHPTRVTPKSVKVFNFYTNTPVRLSTMVNGVQSNVFNFTPQNHRIFHYRIDFSAFTPGDVVELRLARATLSAIAIDFVSQKYLVFPEGKDSYHIGWVNEYEVLEIIEFTGALTFKSPLENRTVLTYKDFIEKLEKVEVKEGQTLTANTGHILKEDARRIRDLMRSKQAFLISRDPKVKPIDLIPKNKEIENLDSDRELYEYEVEFDINLPNDSEIYPR